MPELAYIVEKTRNRNSRAVLRGNTVIIRLARGLPQHEEQRHIDNLFRRMAKAHAKQATKTVIDPFRPLREGEPSLHVELLTGELVTFRVSDGIRTRAKRAHGGWIVTRSPATNDRIFDRFLWRLLSKSALPGMTKLVHEINDRTLRVPIRDVSLKFMKSRWGSCSHKGTIALATGLLFTSKEILEYVIIHELAHVVHMNHSQRFWKLVESHSKDAKNARKALLRYGLQPLK